MISEPGASSAPCKRLSCWLPGLLSISVMAKQRRQVIWTLVTPLVVGVAALSLKSGLYTTWFA